MSTTRSWIGSVLVIAACSQPREQVSRPAIPAPRKLGISTAGSSPDARGAIVDTDASGVVGCEGEVRAMDRYGSTALHHAAGAYYPEREVVRLVRRVLALRPDVNAQTNGG